jgi:aspartyl-tRNA(Asn)/glutamyl-tRNA(Gln) amidotransferase subunit A
MPATQSKDLVSLTASELLALYKTRRLSPVEATRAVLAQADAMSPVLNCFCVRDDEAALASARASEARWMKDAPQGLLDGVPVSIKDLILTRGWPTLRGSRTVDPAGPWEDDAPAVARLREHGAVIFGKTTTPEFGWKGVTDNTLTGITRNPWNTAKTPGGSSGGSSAAIAANIGPLSIGTDGGGSIRIPCSFTGIFGLKPSYGRVPAWPLSPFGTVAHLGPMTRSVADAALMLNVLSEPDMRDWTALPWDPRDYRVGLEDGVRGLRIAYSPDLGGAIVDPEVADIVKAAVQRFTELGAIVEQDDPGLADAGETFARHWFPGATFVLGQLPADKRALVDPGLQEVARLGAAYNATHLLEAAQMRNALGLQMQRFHQSYNLLVTPTIAVPAFDAGQETPIKADGARWTDWTPFSYPFNLTQQPAASINCGFTRAGLPVGMHIVGPRYADALVLRAARAFESLVPYRAPDLSKLKK